MVALSKSCPYQSGGGDFESLRYFEEGSDGNVLVCESFFWPKDSSKEKAVVKWRFQRDD